MSEDHLAPYDYRTQRLFIDAPLSEGNAITLDKPQTNYLLNVLRMQTGENVLVFNGREGEWLAQLQPSSKKHATLKINQQTRAQSARPELKYCFAPLKHARLDYMVQKAVEMGAGELVPVLTHHAQVSRVNVERMRANAVEAAEQCGILAIPLCHDPVKLERFLDDWPQDKVLIFCDEAIAGKATVKTLEELRNSTSRKIAGLLIGPEGGFSPSERQMLRSKPFVLPISLGPRILRADTAAVAALAIIQAVLEDWH